MNRIKLYSFLIITLLICGASIQKTNAQYMPVVYDRTYGELNDKYHQICPVAGGDLVMVGTQGQKTVLTWLQRNGEMRFSKVLPGNYTEINKIIRIGDDKVLIVGQANQGSTKKKNQTVVGNACATMVSVAGGIICDVYSPIANSSFTMGELLKDGNLILGGYEIKQEGHKVGSLLKMTQNGQVIYRKNAGRGAVCTSINVLGSQTEYLHVAYSTEGDQKQASVVRYDSKGEIYFETILPGADFEITNMRTALDGSIFLSGGSADAGGAVIKIRPEGDIVFNKTIVPASAGANLNHLNIAENGNLLVGGNSADRGYCALLRNDGTALETHLVQGSISGMGMNAKNGEVVVVGFDKNSGFGNIIGLSNLGKRMFDKRIDGDFNNVKIDDNGITLASSSTGRVCMMSMFGEIMYDRYAIDGQIQDFKSVIFTPNNEIMMFAEGNRLIKMGHGLYVSDVKIAKPINGYTTARFTVTLTGYSTNDQGAPLPVTVSYKTKEGSANKANHFDPINGSLSFVSTNDGGNRYMVKQEIEVPIKANQFIEGQKMFELILSDANQSYLIKSAGLGVIEDQEAIVKLVATESGYEAGKDAVYELGLFKTNGEALVNATGTNIWIDGVYGKGTADALDYDMGIIPRVTIENKHSTGKFNVKTLSDTRYEMPKTVVVDFGTINALEGSYVRFDGTLLRCAADIIDQPAMISISSLGNHGRMNNIVSGFFTISLLRASDGAIQTNTTGADIQIECAVTGESQAIEGKDFALTNMHDLRIWGDGSRSAVNLNGIVLYNKDQTEDRNVVIEINSISSPIGAPTLTISEKGKKAGFSIKRQ